MQTRLIVATLLLLCGTTFFGQRYASAPFARETRAGAPEADPKAARAADGDAWRIFRGNPRQTGVASSPLPKELKLLWQFATKDGIESAPAVADGVVYVGSLDEHLYAIDLAGGKEKWKAKLGPIKAAPAFKDGLVFVGDIDGNFHCLEAATGKVRWKFNAESEISSGANFAGDRVLFGSGDEHLYCLNPDGKLAWKFRVAGGPVLASPAVIEDRTFVAGCDSNLHAINITNGKELSAVELGGQTGSSAAVEGDRLYVGTMSNQVLAIDWKKSAIAWTFEPERRRQPFFGSPALTDNLVLIGSRDKKLWALDRKTGKDVWSFETEGRVDSSPVVDGNHVYFGSLDGNFYVLDMKGRLVAKHPLDGQITGSPAVAGGRLLIGTTKGTLYCFGAKP